MECGARNEQKQHHHRIPQPGGRGNLQRGVVGGGFASVDPLLLAFIEATEQACGLPLEPLYTGKALLALKAQIEAGRFTPGTRVVFVHTGGLHGRGGFAV